MRKIKILFLVPNLNIGGAERTIVNLLNGINKRKFICKLMLYRKEGELLKKLKPHINVINLSVSNNSPSGSGANPPISTLEIDTDLIVRDGDVVVIGGVFSNTESQSENKVPILGDIPVLGRLFRSDAKVDNQEQVLIFIAPKVL